MPDEAVETPEVQDTSQIEVPEEGTPSQVDWESLDNPYRKRYGDLQPEYTRASQEAAEYRQAIGALQSNDEDERKAAYDFLGFEYPEEETPEDLDPYDQLRSEINSLKQNYAQQQEQAKAAEQHQQTVEYIDQELTSIESDLNVEFTEPEVKAIVALAERLPNDDGKPDVRAAVAQMDEIDKVRSKRRAKRPKPAQVQSGQAGQEKWDRTSAEERTKRMAERIASHED